MPGSTGRKRFKHKADLKVVIVGEKSVGKTCFIHRYLERKFIETTSTIGASFFLKQWGEYNIAIWDTAGEERYTGLSSFYFRGAGAALLAFDLTDDKSFEVLKHRFIPLLESAEDNCLKVVVGTKADLVNDKTREVHQQEGETLARHLNPTLAVSLVPYFETSSISGENVDKAFEFIFKHVLSSQKKEDSGDKKQGIVNLEENDVTKSAKRCCRA